MTHNMEYPGRHLTEWGVPTAQARLAVLAVHGRGQSPAFMRETAERFGSVAARFYAPHAPGNSWYPRSFLEPLEHNQPQLDTALAAIDDALHTLAEAGFPAQQVVLWGFSQGACLLAHHALTTPHPIAGLVLCTGGYIGASRPLLSESAALQRVPAVLRSVTEDPWVSPARVEDTATLLMAQGAHVDLRIDPGAQHGIRDEACAAATQVLQQLA